ncbi:hypothetical protein [Flavobacterium rhizosphaerae]|uniref:Uncharacterized protein n=1 Tax=Flavobacterium rhizosphaerae TaxID=3163298 RepID=A0ABW8YS85_9FLAO
MARQRKTSVHILSTSTNLLGFCLVIITAFHVASKSEMTYIDEVTAIISIFLAVASILSFLSIRTKNEFAEERLERIADYLFLFSLISFIIDIILIALNFL